MSFASLFTFGRALQFLVIPIDGQPYALPEKGGTWRLRLGGLMPDRYALPDAAPVTDEPLDVIVHVQVCDPTFGAGETSYVEGYLDEPARTRVTAFVRVDSLEPPSGLRAVLHADGTTDRVAAALPATAVPVGFVRLAVYGNPGA
jgi:hypothetical protein